MPSAHVKYLESVDEIDINKESKRKVKVRLYFLKFSLKRARKFSFALCIYFFSLLFI